MHRKLSCGVVQDPIIRPLSELDAQSLEALLQDIPLWVKNPDYDRVLTKIYSLMHCTKFSAAQVLKLEHFISSSSCPLLDPLSCSMICFEI
jgi:hypothetical protein